MNTNPSTHDHGEGGPTVLPRAIQTIIDGAKSLKTSAQAAINNLVAGPQMNLIGATAAPTTSTVYRANVADNGKSTSPLNRLATAMRLRPGIETTATGVGTHFRSDLGMGTNGNGIDGAQHDGNGLVTMARTARQT